MIGLNFKVFPKSTITIACIEKNLIFLLSGSEIQMSFEMQLADSLRDFITYKYLEMKSSGNKQI